MLSNYPINEVHLSGTGSPSMQKAEIFFVYNIVTQRNDCEKCFLNASANLLVSLPG